MQNQPSSLCIRYRKYEKYEIFANCVEIQVLLKLQEIELCAKNVALVGAFC